MKSTPNSPNGLFDKIEREPRKSCIYKRLKMDYTYCLDRIYTKEEIAQAKNLLHLEGSKVRQRGHIVR